MSKLTRGLTISVAAGAVLYVVVAAASGFSEVEARLRAYAWWTAAAALGLAAANYGLRFWKWQYYLGRLGIAVPRGRSLAIFLSGFSLTVTPGKVGEVLKSYLLRESDGVPIARSAPIVVAERVTDLIACLLLMVLGVGVAHPTREVLLGAAVGAALVAGLVAAVAFEPLAELGLSMIAKMPIGRRFSAKLREFHASSRTLLGAGPLLVATLISVAAWFCECAAFWVVLRGFTPPGAEGASLPLATFIYASTTVLGAVSLLPGGLGAQEGGMIGLLVASARGIDQATAVASTFVTRICTLWFAVLLGAGALLLVRRKVRVDLGEVQALKREDGA